MPAFSFIAPAVLILGINVSSEHGYQYLPIQNTEQCENNISKLEDKNFMASGYGLCLETGFPKDIPERYGRGENTKVPYYLIAQINNDYEYIAMNDEQHCENNIHKMTQTRFVNEGWGSTPYAICIKTGYPEIAQ